MDKICIDTRVQFGIFRDLYKRKLLTKLQLDKAIEIVAKKEAIYSETGCRGEQLQGTTSSDTGSGVLPS